MRRYHCWIDSGADMNEDDLSHPAGIINGGTVEEAAEEFAFSEAATCDSKVDVIVMNADTGEFTVVTCKAQWRAYGASRRTTRSELMGVTP